MVKREREEDQTVRRREAKHREEEGEERCARGEERGGSMREGMKMRRKRVKTERRTRVEGQGEGKGVSLLGRWRGVFSFVLLQCVCANTNLQGRAAAQNTLSISQ